MYFKYGNSGVGWPYLVPPFHVCTVHEQLVRYSDVITVGCIVEGCVAILIHHIWVSPVREQKTGTFRFMALDSLSGMCQERVCKS